MRQNSVNFLMFSGSLIIRQLVLSSINRRITQTFQHVQVLGVIELRLHDFWVFITVELRLYVLVNLLSFIQIRLKCTLFFELFELTILMGPLALLAVFSSVDCDFVELLKDVSLISGSF